MSGPLVIAVPSKGRLQENAEAFFARAGLNLVKPRGAREYRGGIAGLDNVEVAYLSAADITSQLAQGAAHLGITGEDLVREMIPDAEQRVVLLDGVGFGYANVVVAVPQAWIDVRGMADLDDVATAFRARNDRKMRVATKYVNLTRGFFATHGIVDYRIVESLGATEGAPAAGSAELIVDITTTGATLAANGLKVIEDGIILRSQANLGGLAPGRLESRRRAKPRASSSTAWPRRRARGNSAKCARVFPTATHRIPCRGDAALRRRCALWRAVVVRHAHAACAARIRCMRWRISCGKKAPTASRSGGWTMSSRATTRSTPSWKRGCSCCHAPRRRGIQ